MPKTPYYSPQIRRDLITKLYHRAKAEKVPMTKLTNRLLDEAMSNEQQSCCVKEEPKPQKAA